MGTDTHYPTPFLLGFVAGIIVVGLRKVPKHSTPLECPWDVLGTSLGRPWGVLGASLRRPWDVLGASLGRPWDVLG
eukprot:287284-Lingulodinium_polyedra.AAC.2